MIARENIFDLYLFYTKVSYILDIYCKEYPRYAWSILIPALFKAEGHAAASPPATLL